MPPNIMEAQSWLMKAADRNYQQAQSLLARMYMDGRIRGEQGKHKTDSAMQFLTDRGWTAAQARQELGLQPLQPPPPSSARGGWDRQAGRESNWRKGGWDQHATMPQPLKPPTLPSARSEPRQATSFAAATKLARSLSQPNQAQQSAPTVAVRRNPLHRLGLVGQTTRLDGSQPKPTSSATGAPAAIHRGSRRIPRKSGAPRPSPRTQPSPSDTSQVKIKETAASSAEGKSVSANKVLQPTSSGTVKSESKVTARVQKNVPARNKGLAAPVTQRPLDQKSRKRKVAPVISSDEDEGEADGKEDKATVEAAAREEEEEENDDGDEGDSWPCQTLVWAKVSNFPYWPGQVTILDDIADDKLRATLKRNKKKKGLENAVLVLFYQSFDVSWVKLDRLAPFHSAIQGFLKAPDAAKGVASPELRLAVEQAQKELRSASSPGQTSPRDSQSSPLKSAVTQAEPQSHRTTAAVPPKKRGKSQLRPGADCPAGGPEQVCCHGAYCLSIQSITLAACAECQ
jgi:hypothetical protein